MDPKDEKEIKKILESVKNEQKGVTLGFLVHKNFSMHFLLMMIINLVVAAATIGIFQFFEYPVIEVTLASFIIYMLLFTAVESLIKGFLFKYFMRAIILSIGLINLLIAYLIFYSMSLVVPDLEYIKPHELLNALIFSFTFSIIRNIIVYYIRRRQFERQVKKWH